VALRGGCAMVAERHAVFVRGEVGVCATSADEGRNAFMVRAVVQFDYDY